MAEVTEIRVHGVSGTAPRYMLRTDPILTGRRPPPADASEANEKTSPVELSQRGDDPPDHEVIAYNWSKLTSGRPRHALWLLLMPYTFLNASGWMLPPRLREQAQGKPPKGVLTTTQARWFDVLVRLSGGVVTMMFTVFTLAVLIDLLGAKCQIGSEVCASLSWLPEFSPGAWLLVATVLTLLVIGLIGIGIGLEPGRKRQSQAAMERFAKAGGKPPAADEGESDPAARLTITDPDFWRHRPLTTYLVLAHMGIAAIGCGWVLTSIRRHTTGITVSYWLMVGASLIVFGVLVLASSQAFSSWMPQLSWTALMVGAIAWIVAVIDAWGLSDLEWDDIAVEAGISQAAVWVTAVITGAGLIVWVIGWRSKSMSTAGSAAMIVLGGLVGSALGAGVYTLAQRGLAPGADPGVLGPLAGMDWPAFLFLAFLLIFIGGALFTMAFGKLELVEKPLVSEGLRAVTTAVRMHLGAPAGLALVGAAAFVAWTFVKEGAEVQSPFLAAEALTRGALVGLSIAVAALLVYVTHRYFGWKIAAAAAAGITVFYLLVSFGKITEIKVLGAVVRFDSLREITLSVALLVPVGFIISRMISTVRDREQRRGIAILWDLGSFWPRWYHPFGAPTYGPVAVPDLAALVLEKSEKGSVVLAAHSQGSVISMAALLAIPAGDPRWGRIAYLTYGNPVCHLYGRLFGGHFTDEAVSEVSVRLGGEAGSCTEAPDPAPATTPRWRNLWRQSDPIGGDIRIPGVASSALDENVADGHSAYEATQGFKDARDELKSLVE